VLPVAGGRQRTANATSLLDAQFLLLFTDATFLVVLDAVPNEQVEATWCDMRRMWVETGDIGAVNRQLKENLPAAARSENKFLRELMLSSVVKGQARRLRFRMLPKLDTIYHLPIAAFTTRHTSWEALTNEHGSCGTRQTSRLDLAEESACLLVRRGGDPPGGSKLDALHPDLEHLAAAINHLDYSNVEADHTLL